MESRNKSICDDLNIDFNHKRILTIVFPGRLNLPSIDFPNSHIMWLLHSTLLHFIVCVNNAKHTFPEIFTGVWISVFSEI